VSLSDDALEGSHELAEILEREDPELQQPETDSLMRELPPGLHIDVSPASYHVRSLGLCSKHILDKVAKGPAYYRAWVNGLVEETDTKAFSLGRAVHCAVLEPSRYEVDYAIEPDVGDRRYKNAKTKLAEWRRDNAHRTHIGRKDAKVIAGIVASARAHPLIARVLERGVFESTLRWRDPETGLECKARPDWYCEELAVCLDLKSCEDASETAFARDAANYDYHSQEGFYRMGFEELGIPLAEFDFACAEKIVPHMCALYTLDPIDVHMGREEMRRAMRTLADCLERDEWPGLPTDVRRVPLPRWRRTRGSGEW
jgi:hypothetical protein